MSFTTTAFSAELFVRPVSIAQPHQGAHLWVCSEAFSASQGWVERALESAQRAFDRLLA